MLLPDAHKYSRGIVAICAGSEKYPGAALLAVGGARRGGSGYVQFISQSTRIVDLVVSKFPDVVPIKSSHEIKADALLIGSGGATLSNPPTDIPLVLDGAAIALAKKTRNPITVITPHEGEIGYLGVARDTRLETAVSLAKQYKCFVVLKGPRTVIASPYGTHSLDRKGGPELATAGSGDILAGLITSMLASYKPSSEEVLDVLIKAVAMHSHAGRCAGKKVNPVVATDILDALAHVN